MQQNYEVPIRVLIGKVGLDGHERGARVVSLMLRDEGMEVIYTGIRQTVESIVQVAIQEDVDVVGLSSLAGAHDLSVEIVNQLKKKGKDDVLVIVGGIIPDEDIPLLKEGGVSAVFGPGASIKDIVKHIQENVRKGNAG
jgi:methylmalonyl-CoA mutase C-terminal domain/subunit